MQKRLVRQRVAAAVGGGVMMLAAGHAFGAAFALQENSASGLGNAYAGGAASGEDASTVWFNPAGMSRIAGYQVAAAIHAIGPSGKFHDNGSAAAAQQPLGGEGGEVFKWAGVPNLYFVAPLTRELSFGIGVNAPFGLVTEYDDNWIGRYQAVKSDVMTININPALSYRFGNFTVGAGVNYQHVKAQFTSKVNYSGALAQAAAIAAGGGQIPAAVVPPFLAATTGLDANADINADDNAWGWNLGALLEFDRNARIGAHYRSSIKYKAAGDAQFGIPSAPNLPPTLAPVYTALSGAVNAQLANTDITADIELPAIFNLSFFQTLNDRWDIMADVQWTGWSSIEELTFKRTNGSTLSSTPENFRDSWRFSVGANYRQDDRWMFRGGIAYDQSPVRDEFRTPRLPTPIAPGCRAACSTSVTPALKLDVGATYIFVKNGSIDKIGDPPSQPTYGRLKGDYDNYVLIFSGQLTYSF
jgi:long-chain fatty acid transport protein